MRLTTAEYARLPKLAQDIVDADRSIDAICNRVVTPFARAHRTDLRQMIVARNALTKRADDAWGNRAAAPGAGRS